MARSKSGGTRSYIRGRIGADVYAIGKDGKGTKQQVARSLAEEVANPRTLAQQRSRMIMNGVAQLVRALKPIISHSFDGIPAGQPSISHFRKLAFEAFNADAQLTTPTFGYLAKDSKLIPACAVQFAKGRLKLPVETCVVADNQYTYSYPNIGFLFNLKGPARTNTFNGAEILDDFFGQHEDIIITMVGVAVDNYSSPASSSVYIGQAKVKANVENVTTTHGSLFVKDLFELDSVMGMDDILYSGDSVSDNQRACFSMSFKMDLQPNNKGVLGGCIISLKKDGKWMHTDGYLNMPFAGDGTYDANGNFDLSVPFKKFPLSFADALATYPVGTTRFLDGGDI